MQKVYLKTLGCKVNSFDGDALRQQLAERGFAFTQQSEEADVHVINSCSVTAKADSEARYLARRFRKLNPKTYTVVTGCYAQTDSQALVELEEVDLVVPNAVKQDLCAILEQRLASRALGRPEVSKLPAGQKAVEKNRQGHFKSSLTLFDRPMVDKARVFLKIQDGCNGFCTYCLIPYARGASRSVPPADVVREVLHLEKSGVAEVVFTGIHIGDYGEDLPSSSFAGLLEDLFQQTKRIRVRISSLEPSELKPELLRVLSQYRHRMCDHFHLPLQSGSDPVLARMRRQYTVSVYAQAVADLKTIFPRASIGADVIPGFPGETEDDHQATLGLVRQCRLSYLHVFPYSKRPNTAAMRMSGHVPGEVVKARASELRSLSEELQRTYAQPFVGTHLDVVWERDVDSQGRRKGVSGNYLQVLAGPGVEAEPGAMTRVKLAGWQGPKLLVVPV